MSLTDKLDEVFPTSFEFRLRKKDEYSVEAVLDRYFVYRYNKDRKIFEKITDTINTVNNILISASIQNCSG